MSAPTTRAPGVLRPATAADRAAVLRWRNHPKVRQASFTRHEISAAEHAVWWDTASADPMHHLLIFQWGDRPSGVVTIREPVPPDGTARWAFYLDVAGLDEHGELLPAWVAAERVALDYAFDTLRLTRLCGEVLTDNRAVLDLHRRFGFAVTGSYLRDIDGATHEVARVELSSADRRQSRSDQAAGALR